MAATEQEMMERAARIQTIEELREACAEFGVEMSPEDEQAFMAAKAELRELSEGVIEKLKLLTDAEFAELEFPPD